MTSAKDAQDILAGRKGEENREITNTSLKEQALSHGHSKRVKKRTTGAALLPDGTSREVKALREGEGVQKLLPDIEIDTSLGYKHVKAKLGIQKVRSWKWTPFINQARTDNAILYHWVRAGEENKKYQFARHNDRVGIPEYTEEEYKIYLEDSEWSMEETKHLLELCDRFDLRFIIIKDRYDIARFPPRSVEELKDRYYTVCNCIVKLRAIPGEDLSESLVAYDVEHEKLRKEQLELLFGRTQKQIEEHDYLVEEVKKVEYRRKERERIAQTAQKLIEQVEISDDRCSDKNKRSSTSKKKEKSKKDRDRDRDRSGNITKHLNKIIEERGAGPYLRSYRLKVPNTMTNKRAKAMEQLLDELGIGTKPIATENVTTQFNVLRNNVLLLLELKSALLSAEFEWGAIKHKYETLPESGSMTDVENFLEYSMDEGEGSGSFPKQTSSRSSTPTTRKRKGTTSSQELPKKSKVITTTN
ncbi:DNA methyltransferase 1-associated protein 1 isoform X2 [Oopsacas minuta]|uniref:DNA methyltransferase 1-associated protein 1 n=1 Tax=Oopsacas minuta TaxID=111878 RepID=A0AAV7K5P6_9METZ|nr:DNA methyltransferase 1-associated protein 1 isoform X2 [Oopsacas minuta]